MQNYDFSISLSSKIYSADEILKAHHYISNLVIMAIQEIDENLQCNFKIISSEYCKDEIIQKFYYQLSREQVKKILAKENQKIRDLIVEQAFKPIENLTQVIDEL